MIYVVSGAPRSGTSLMMRLLKVGGIEVVYSEKREQHLRETLPGSNPYFYEHSEHVSYGTAGFSELDGKAVKIMLPVLHWITSTDVKLIVMVRDGGSRCRSYEAIKGRKVPVHRGQAYRDMVWKAVRRFNGTSVIYDDLIDHPEREIDRIIEYLNRPMDRASMLKEIDPSRRHWIGGEPCSG